MLKQTEIIILEGPAKEVLPRAAELAELGFDPDHADIRPKEEFLRSTLTIHMKKETEKNS